MSLLPERSNQTCILFTSIWATTEVSLGSWICWGGLHVRDKPCTVLTLTPPKGWVPLGDSQVRRTWTPELVRIMCTMSCFILMGSLRVCDPQGWNLSQLVHCLLIVIILWFPEFWGNASFYLHVLSFPASGSSFFIGAVFSECLLVFSLSTLSVLAR